MDDLEMVKQMCRIGIISFLFHFVFFFKQKTAYEMRISDWSSDVCSSDLVGRDGVDGPGQHLGGHRVHADAAGEEGVDELGGRVGDDEGLPQDRKSVV